MSDERTGIGSTTRFGSKGGIGRLAMLAATFALAATVATAAPAAGGPDRHDLCHYDTDADEYVLLSLPTPAHDAHSSRHEHDIAPNSDGECAQEEPPVLLARSYTTMSDGSERLIAQLVDTDESATISGGDVIQVAGFPASHDPDPAEVPVQVTEHVVPSDVPLTIQFTATRMSVAWQRVEDGKTVYRSFDFADLPGSTQWYAEVMSPDFGNVPAVFSSGNDYRQGGSLGDLIQTDTATPSMPTQQLYLRAPAETASQDSTFLDTEIYLP